MCRLSPSPLPAVPVSQVKKMPITNGQRSAGRMGKKLQFLPITKEASSDDNLPTITTSGPGSRESGESSVVARYVVASAGHEQPSTQSLMLPLSPRELADLLASHGYPCRPTTVEKLCVLIDRLYTLARKRAHGRLEFQYSNAAAEEVVSRVKGKRPLAVLDAIGLTEVVSPHRSTISPKASTRRFVQTSFQAYLVPLGKAARDKKQRAQTRTVRRRAQDQCWTWVEQSMPRIGWRDDDLDEVRRAAAGNKVAERVATGERRQSWKGQYRWNCFCNVPKNAREKLIVDGEHTVSLLDISCSFGIFLPALVEDDVRYRSSDRELPRDTGAELRQLRDLLSSEDLYMVVGFGMPRDAAKKAFQRVLNGKKLDPPAKKVLRALEGRFPQVASVLKRRKAAAAKRGKMGKKSRSTVFSELQGRQADVINKVVLRCAAAGIPCVPIWDEVIVPLANRATVLGWMHEMILEATGVRAKVAGHRMQRQAPACPDGYCQDCWSDGAAIPLSSPFGCRHNLKPDPFPEVDFLDEEYLLALKTGA